MARNSDRDRTKRASTKPRPPGRQHSCAFCQVGAEWVDFKDTALLRRFLSDRGKIRARRVTGNCARHQRDVAIAIKTAREVALMPYAQYTVSERGQGRGSRSGGVRHRDQSNTTTSTENAGQVEVLDLNDVDVDVHELEEVDA